MPGISGAILLITLKPLPKGVELLLSKDSLTRVLIDQEPVRFIYTMSFLRLIYHPLSS